MPGRVVLVEVAVGQAVQPGDGLIILEAMKMENEFKATVAGTVKEIRVESGPDREPRRRAAGHRVAMAGDTPAIR